MRITTELIRRCSSRNLLPGNGDERNFERITHLYLQEHHIRKIENLECCKNLTALYLYDNKIEKIENLDSLVQLKILYLHFNFIPRIENLDRLSQITVLNLSHNTIERVEGLESLPELRELYIDYQILPGDQALEFDPRTILFLSENLRVLNVSGNKLERLVDLRPFKYLEVFVAEENELSDLEEVAAVAGGWTFLVSLKLAGNPVCGCRKYVDDLVVNCLELEELDGRVIQPSHRNYLLNRKQCLALESLKKESYQVLRPFLETRPSTSTVDWDNLSVVQSTTAYFDDWYHQRLLPFWDTLKNKCKEATGSLVSVVQGRFHPSRSATTTTATFQCCCQRCQNERTASEGCSVLVEGPQEGPPPPETREEVTPEPTGGRGEEKEEEEARVEQVEQGVVEQELPKSQRVKRKPKSVAAPASKKKKTTTSRSPYNLRKRTKK